MAHTDEALEARLARMERTVRRLTNGIVLILLVLASVVWMGQRTTKKKTAPPPPPKVVEAERFVVKRPSGQILGTFGLIEDRPMLTLNGPDLTERLNLSLGPDGTPRVSLLARDGRPLALLTVNDGGETQLELTGAAGAGARFVAGQVAAVSLRDEQGQVRTELQVDGETSGLTLSNREGVPRAAVVSIDRGPGMMLNGPDGNPRLMLTVRPEQAALGINDAKGDVRAGLGVRNNEPAFALYGPSGRPLFIKP